MSPQPWQERVLPGRRTGSVRAKLGWILTLLVVLTLLPVGAAVLTVHRASRAIEELPVPGGSEAASAPREAVLRSLSEAERDLVVGGVVVLALALGIAVTAPSWLLRPVHRLSAALQMARDRRSIPDDLPFGEDEIGRLGTYLREHLERDRDVDELRARVHRALIARLEAMSERLEVTLVAVNVDHEIVHAGRRAREALGITDSADLPLPLSKVWEDEALEEALGALEEDEDSAPREVEAQGGPFAGRPLRLLRTRAGDPAEREILVLVPVETDAEEGSG